MTAEQAISYLPDLLLNALASLWRVGVGVSLALLTGTVFGLLRSELPLFIKKNVLFGFLMEAPKFPPPIAWIPFVILTFGISEWGAYAIVFIGAIAPVFSSAYEGAERTPQILLDTARSLELSRLQILFKVKLRSSLPQIGTGLRIGTGMGWMSVIAAEMVSGQNGLGYSIQINRLNLNFSFMILDMTMIGLIGYVIHAGLIRLERALNA